MFGASWGVWGASVPAVRDQAGVSEGQLGTALLFVGAGALPATWGRFAEAADLPTAMLAVAALGAGLAALGGATARLLSPAQTETRRACSRA